ncbi:hypothetical protein EDF56_102113 [Novosphingobium sp. PhB165]|uniref:homogentisate 1,2-dioxygenase n=1 Tax=Novosphingobium sp. PhB165 TaxID=2485105 RepID=UPI0010E6A784|nr:homogentisate 1,2-dioxygenase [Novosphingobium sp. PhB165]TCM20452.1 hypothetical protein EDF56_102113 [Novosphingobium sp. PhB165]
MVTGRGIGVLSGGWALAALLASGAAGAQEMANVVPDPIACPSTPVALPPELSAWNSRTTLVAAGDAHGLTAARLEVGKAVDGGLRATPEVHFALRPEKPGGSVSFGGIFAFTITEPGKYRVALGSAAWIDVVKGGAAVSSIAHGHGPDCSGIRKMVDFTLEPGDYQLQISANPESRLPLLIARLP